MPLNPRIVLPVSIRLCEKVLQSAFVDSMMGEYLIRAQRVHESAVVVDTHCDTTQRLMDDAFDFGERHQAGHIDIPRLRAGAIDAVFLAVFAPPPLEPGAVYAAAQAQIERIRDTIDRHNTHLSYARTAAEVRGARDDGRIAIIVAIEGGHLIEDSLDILRAYHSLGASYLTLTHAAHTSWADSSGVHEPLAPLHGGLTSFGRDVVRELNRLGMMVDVSHVSDDTFRDVVETSAAPVVATHSSCRAVSPHRRNLTDEMMRAIAESGGVVQINFSVAFVDPKCPPIDPDVVRQWHASGGLSRNPVSGHVTPLSVLADHFDHALQLIGPDHVGIGSDFDGVPAVPAGMEDCSKLANLTAELLRRGYGEADLGKMLGENVLRVMDSCHKCAQRLQGPHPSV